MMRLTGHPLAAAPDRPGVHSATIMTDSAVAQLAQLFESAFGRPAAGMWAAPGRVNLIGEHTDYNDGLVMPFALAQRVRIAAAPRDDGRWTVRSQHGGSQHGEQQASFGPADLKPGMPGWQAYLAGIVWSLQQAGHRVEGADLALTSNVPIGAGLSSSAALECATLTALVDLNGLDISLLEQAKLARRCENDFVGAPTGLMDQAASILCRADHALLLDCRSFDHEQVPLRLAEHDLELLVLDTHTPHDHVASEYAARRESCERAAATLGIPTLRDITDLESALDQLTDPVIRRRVRHVVTENARVRAAAEVLRADQPADLGPLLDASHASMRDDFEITVPTVDLAVVTAREAGALGARMTGGGFGGCVIALVPVGSSGQLADHIRTAFDRAGFTKPSHFVSQPAAGAGRLDPAG